MPPIHTHILSAPRYNTLSTHSIHINTHYNNHKITQTGSPALSTDYITITKWNVGEKAVDPSAPLFSLLHSVITWASLVWWSTLQQKDKGKWYGGIIDPVGSGRGHYLLLCLREKRVGGCVDTWVESRSEFEQKCTWIYDINWHRCPVICEFNTSSYCGWLYGKINFNKRVL